METNRPFTVTDMISYRAANSIAYETREVGGLLASLKGEIARMEEELAAGSLGYLHCRLGQMEGSMNSLGKSIGQIDKALVAKELLKELAAEAKGE